MMSMAVENVTRFVMGTLGSPFCSMLLMDAIVCCSMFESVTLGSAPGSTGIIGSIVDCSMLESVTLGSVPSSTGIIGSTGWRHTTLGSAIVCVVFNCVILLVVSSFDSIVALNILASCIRDSR